MVRVLLAVRHDRLRAALHEVLLLPGEFICGEASNMDELWAHLLRQDWNVLLLDMSFPEQTKLQTVRTLRHSYPRLPILPISILSGYCPEALGGSRSIRLSLKGKARG